MGDLLIKFLHKSVDWSNFGGFGASSKKIGTTSTHSNHQAALYKISSAERSFAYIVEHMGKVKGMYDPQMC